MKQLISPPAKLTRQQWTLLFALMSIALVVGYQGSITTQAISFAKDEFGATEQQQGQALAAIRFDILISLVIVKLADRLGRRNTLIVGAIVGPILTAFSALAPSLYWLAGMQVVSRSVVTATAVLITVVGVEEMPAPVRAWASSLMVAAAAFGTAVLFLPLAFADTSPGFWRLMYLPPLLGIPAVFVAARYISETKRFTDLAIRRSLGKLDTTFAKHLPRLAIIGAWLILMGIFTTPARQFLNDYLREERGFSSGKLSLFGVLTNIPGSMAVLFGGAISDRKGRRFSVSLGLFGFAIGTAVLYLSDGSLLWGGAMLASVFGAFALPSLGIIVPELFPTALRSQASGFSTGFNRIGSAIGLLFGGWLAGHLGYGPTVAWLSISLFAGAAVVFFFVPESSRHELEELNPEDETVSTNSPPSPR
jgi:MFS family permease